ncbi:hypothetical protein MMC13_006962 [Lambiella insularis]|nr:hypothetical protein [Lambiella insularis]
MWGLVRDPVEPVKERTVIFSNIKPDVNIWHLVAIHDRITEGLISMSTKNGGSPSNGMGLFNGGGFELDKKHACLEYKTVALAKAMQIRSMAALFQGYGISVTLASSLFSFGGSNQNSLFPFGGSNQNSLFPFGGSNQNSLFPFGGSNQNSFSTLF